jgi:hypothetical protein
MQWWQQVEVEHVKTQFLLNRKWHVFVLVDLVCACLSDLLKESCYGVKKRIM